MAGRRVIGVLATDVEKGPQSKAPSREAAKVLLLLMQLEMLSSETKEL